MTIDNCLERDEGKHSNPLKDINMNYMRKKKRKELTFALILAVVVAVACLLLTLLLLLVWVRRIIFRAITEARWPMLLDTSSRKEWIVCRNWN